jgi:hypothetical protein
VRALVFDLIAESIAAGVSVAVRQAVEAVRALGGETGTVTPAAVAQRLKVDRNSALRRCQAAKVAGYLINEETTRGREARYRIGEPMPTDTPVLPSVEAVGCASAGEGRGGVVYPLLSQRCAVVPGYDSATAELEGVHDLSPTSDADDTFEERAAILEYDGGLSRADAEMRASGGAACFPWARKSA